VSAARRARQAFRELHGRAAAGVWSAPGRVNLIGEHTDYNDGFVLPFALPHRTAVAGAARSDGLLSVITVGDDGRPQRAAPLPVADLTPGSVAGWAAYPFGVAWALREHLASGPPSPTPPPPLSVAASAIAGGADLVVASDVPSGAGLSSSAALECAVALALLGIAGQHIDPPAGHEPGLDAFDRMAIARLAQRAENGFVGVPSGLLDQAASMCCVDGHALFFDVRSGRTEQVAFDIAAQGLEVLVIDTRVNHSLHGASNGSIDYGDRRQSCDRAAALLGITSLRDVKPGDLVAAQAHLPAELRQLMRHVVTENARVVEAVALLRADRPADIGPLLTASHASLRDDYRVSCAELDVAVDIALTAGALGARMTGAGFGGSAIALVPATERPAIEHAVTDAFARHDWTPPRTFTATPSAGAGREDG
jgi:galactokinase